VAEQIFQRLFGDVDRFVNYFTRQPLRGRTAPDADHFPCVWNRRRELRGQPAGDPRDQQSFRLFLSTTACRSLDRHKKFSSYAMRFRAPWLLLLGFLPKNMLAFFKPAVEELTDGLLDFLHFALDNGVLVVMPAAEAHGLAEV